MKRQYNQPPIEMEKQAQVPDYDQGITLIYPLGRNLVGVGVACGCRHVVDMFGDVWAVTDYRFFSVRSGE